MPPSSDRTQRAGPGGVMNSAEHEFQALLHEHRALMREYGRAQTRCSASAAAQAAAIERLEGEVLRLRAAVVVRDTALAWALEPALDSARAAADLVLCQTGCLSHGAYWRAQDQCRRTGRVCVLVMQPEALAAHAAAAADGGTAGAARAASTRKRAREQRGHVDAACVDRADHAA